MKQEKYLFIDRDGTLIIEPPDNQVDSIKKLQFMPQVFTALFQLKKMGYKLVMVSNQDGLGTSSYPQDDFNKPHDMMLSVFKSQGIEFDDIRICPHFLSDNCDCRKPKIGLLMDYVIEQKIDLKHSYVIGDRDTDAELAKNLRLQFIRIGTNGFKCWSELSRMILNNPRQALVKRKTKETEISVELNLDSADDIRVNTGIGFFDHMLEQIVKHAGISATININGDLEIDDHHTIEDAAIAFGTALKDALSDKRGITRYGFLLPMDESCATISLDLSGRNFCKFECEFSQDKIGDMSTEMIGHFFRSFATGLQATLHINVSGENSHHMCESAFKGLGRTLKQAIKRDGDSLPSTKGIL